MKIENGNNPIQPQGQYANANRAQGAKDGATRLEGSATSVDVTSVEGLLNLVSDATEVRKSLVAEVKLKIQAGEYLAQQSAVETARSILDL